MNWYYTNGWKKENHNYNDCLIESFEINGYDCILFLCDCFFIDATRDFVVLAHNGADYDNIFLYCNIVWVKGYYLQFL